MAVFSKSSVQNFGNLNCAEIVHPWNKNCVKGNLELVLDSSKGFFFFYIMMHGTQYLFRLKNKKKIYISQIVINFMRSMLFGVSYATLFISLNCLYQKILGKFNEPLFVYFVPIMCGVPIFVETSERRKITVTTFLSMFLESFYKVLVNRKIIVRSMKLETVLFMLVNAFLMYGLRVRQEFDNKKDTLWFFTPASPKNEDLSENMSQNNEKKCPHQSSCSENIIRNTLKYTIIGFGMSLVKFLINNVMSASKIKESFFQWRSLQLTYFMSSYIFIFEALNCYLCKLEGKPDSIHTFWSGLLAGISYRFSPSLQIMSTAATILLKILGDKFKERYNLPDLPYGELTFLLSNMFLLQRVIFDFQSVPKFFYNLLIFATAKKATVAIDAINKNFHYKAGRLF